MHNSKLQLTMVLVFAVSLVILNGCGDGGGTVAPAGEKSVAGTASQPAVSAPVTPAVKAATQAASRGTTAATTEQAEKSVEKPLPLKDQMRTLWKPPLPGVIYNWLACGPFPVTPPTSQPASMPATDFLVDMGGESAVRPLAGQEVRRKDGTVAKWTEFTSKTDIVYLQDAMAKVNIEPSVAYFAATVQMAKSGRKIIDLSSRD